MDRWIEKEKYEYTERQMEVHKDSWIYSAIVEYTERLIHKNVRYTATQTLAYQVGWTDG
jgi:hypothetical protein